MSHPLLSQSSITFFSLGGDLRVLNKFTETVLVTSSTRMAGNFPLPHWIYRICIYVLATSLSLGNRSKLEENKAVE
jgi:hypothetical protein